MCEGVAQEQIWSKKFSFILLVCLIKTMYTLILFFYLILMTDQ